RRSSRCRSTSITWWTGWPRRAARLRPGSHSAPRPRPLAAPPRKCWSTAPGPARTASSWTLTWCRSAAGHGLVYLFPHTSTVVLGGTQDTGSWSREPDPAAAARIIARCAAVEPALRNAAVIAHKAGLRPTRPQVRLEAEDLAGG